MEAVSLEKTMKAHISIFRLITGIVAFKPNFSVITFPLKKYVQKYIPILSDLKALIITLLFFFIFFYSIDRNKYQCLLHNYRYIICCYQKQHNRCSAAI